VSLKDAANVILEAIVTSISEEGKVNFAPVGVHVPDDSLRIVDVKEFELRLYPGSSTFSNLKRVPEGVINFSDDVLCFVETALFSDIPPTFPSHDVRAATMANAKAAWEFTVQSFDDSQLPAVVRCSVVRYREMGSFGGFCRAQGAVLEAAIAATRLQWMPASAITDSWASWQEIVTKTGGNRELEAFRKVTEYLVRHGLALPR
jgi:uncharacterized protein